MTEDDYNTVLELVEVWETLPKTDRVARLKDIYGPTNYGQAYLQMHKLSLAAWRSTP